MATPKKITVSVISDLVTDQRVIRICTTLQKMGFDVHVIARKTAGSLPLQSYPFTAIRFHCYFNSGIMMYAEFMSRLFLRLLFARTDYFLANDLDSLVPNFVVSRLRGKYLFYDTHEYFTGVPELAHSPVKRKIWKRLEDWIFPKLRTIYTVNNSVKEEYEKQYHVPLGVIRNVPMKADIVAAPVPASWQNKIILLVQGAGLNEGRSCIEMIEAMPLLDDRFHMVFIGGGTQWQALQKKRASLQLEARIDMLEKMLPSKLRGYTALAHLGISLDSFTDKNCLFNLPNKVFDYLQAGVPLFATAIHEVKQIIDSYQCGICITDTSPEHIANAITELFSDTAAYERLKANALAAGQELTWEREAEKLEDMYRPFL